MSGILIRRGSSLLAVAYGSSFSKSFIASNAAQQQLSTSSYPNNEITLYQYKICPFCNKVKAYLDYRGISYNTVEVNPITKSQIKTLKGEDGTEFKKVPVAIINGTVINESDDIIKYINNQGNESDSKRVIEFTKDTEKWMEWSEKKLAVMLYPNITRNFNESWEAFEYCGDVDEWDSISRISNRYLGPVAMYFANGKIKKKYNIMDERTELLEVVDTWLSALTSTNGDFLQGKVISMSDIVVYGVLKAINGLPAFKFVMQERPLLEVWYNQVDEEVHK